MKSLKSPKYREILRNRMKSYEILRNRGNLMKYLQFIEISEMSKDEIISLDSYNFKIYRKKFEISYDFLRFPRISQDFWDFLTPCTLDFKSGWPLGFIQTCTILYLYFFCQKVKAVNDILNYSSNNNNTVFELTNVFFKKKSIDRLLYN